MMTDERPKMQMDINAWNKLRRGDIEGLNYFFEKLAKQLVRYGLNRVGLEQSKDCLQETFLSLWEHRLSLGETDSPVNYIYATYRRKLLKKNKMAEMTDFSDDIKLFELPIETEDAYSDRHELRPHIKKLSDKQKEIIYLKYYQGMDYDEIAGIMEMNYQSARNLMSRAIKSLRSAMSLFTL